MKYYKLNPELEKLIDLALADGVLTDKERAVIQKKAESLGVDQDEFEMILEGKLHIAQKAAAPPPPTADEKPGSNKEGDLKKCPSCGAPVGSFATKCEHCGHEFRNIDSNTSIKKLMQMLDNVESSRKNSSAIGSMMNQAFGGFMGSGDKVDTRKKEIIKNFPIPNTKEDILEFLALAVPNAKKVGNFFTSGAFNSPANARNKIHNDFVPVWQAKCEQIIMKARFSMKEDKKTLEEIEYYAKQLNIK